VTAVRNAASEIETTIESVFAQTYKKFEYIVVDGASTDGTLRVVNGYGDRIAHVISEPDDGLYDALSKGFARARGEILCYINAGDFFLPYALGLVADVFRDPKISWLTGCRTVANSQNVITDIDLPFRYRSKLIRHGSYGRTLPFIQQESTFWRADLMQSVDMDYWRACRAAGDYFLWWSFASKAELAIVSSPLGVFKKHRGQISENIEAYLTEIESFAERRGLTVKLAEAIELAGWALHPGLRACLVRTVLRYNHEAGKWQLQAGVRRTKRRVG
jgi:glycosyltransferase involved in cell wall biosynthesis